MLGLDNFGRLSPINRAVKENLKTYLNEYKILTDGVNFSDGFIINIGVDFEVVCNRNDNKSEVVTKCILELQKYFNIDNWTFNQTINLSELEVLLANIEGVSSVTRLQIVNKCGGQYSANSYNIEAATKNKVVYPSLDPSIFEVKFPNSDIKGRAR
jgi:acetone carboxylase gamma subunit